MNANMILAVLVFFPMLGGLLGYALRGAKPAGVHFAENGTDNGKENTRATAFFSGGAWMTVFTAIAEFLLMLAVFVCFAGKAGDGAVLSLYLPGICGFGLSFTLDGFRLVYALIAAFMWMMTALLCPEYFAGHAIPSPTISSGRPPKGRAHAGVQGNMESQAHEGAHAHPDPVRFYVFFLLTLGATMGVFLSADLYTTFIFFEMMSFTSYVWVAHEENNAALRAADTYLAVAVLGGLVMLMGIFGIWHELGTLTISELPAASAAYGGNQSVLYALGCCLLVGFGAKAGAFPLHIWLPKAHPVAPAPASALLSGILTKTGIYGILVTTCGLFLYDQKWGTLILAIGAITMFGGALLAVFSIDLKRTLACSSMSQIGFILIGVGMQCMLGGENALAVHGTMLHMMNHSMIKLVLFMAAGVIYMNVHALDLNVIRGYGRKKPLLKVIFLVGALAIGGIPLFGGYISKTLLHESILEYAGGWVFRALEYLFLLSGGLTVAYMTKLFTAIFIEKNEDSALQKKYDGQKKYMNPQSTFALAGSAAVLLVWGLFPHTIMDRAAQLGQSFMGLEEFGHVVSYFSLKNLSGAMISIVIGALVYAFVIRKLLMKKNAYINAWPAWLDLENLIYRPLMMQFLPFVFGAVCHVLDVLTDTLVRILIPTGRFIARVFDSLVDWSVVGLRKSVYRDSPIPRERVEGNWLTDAAGHLLNALQWIANRTWRRGRPTHVNYRHTLAVRFDVWKESNMVIERSFSFGLLLVIVGFCLTLVYILWW